MGHPVRTRPLDFVQWLRFPSCSFSIFTSGHSLHSDSIIESLEAGRLEISYGRKRMKRWVTAICGLALLLGMAVQSSAVAQEEPVIAKTTLKPGDVAPDFTLLGNNWKQVKLSDYRGKKNVILAFYVLAFTGG